MSLLVIAVIIVASALSPVLGKDTRTPELLDPRVRSLIGR
jgi:hypothetical protein